MSCPPAPNAPGAVPSWAFGGGAGQTWLLLGRPCCSLRIPLSHVCYVTFCTPPAFWLPMFHAHWFLHIIYLCECFSLENKKNSLNSNCGRVSPHSRDNPPSSNTTSLASLLYVLHVIFPRSRITIILNSQRRSWSPAPHICKTDTEWKPSSSFFSLPPK